MVTNNSFPEPARHREAGGACLPPPPHPPTHPPPPTHTHTHTHTHTFLCSKKQKRKTKEKRKKRKKETVLKCCHQGQNVTVLAILEHLEFKDFSCWPTMVTDNRIQGSMPPLLWNQFRRPWFLANLLYFFEKPTAYLSCKTTKTKCKTQIKLYRTNKTSAAL